ncbi:LysM peptidoglycan-binding domain-containing protein [Microcoleus sp. FACHB-1515]|uniref:CIS tube protein n=1 Tax=Cyanophyceae TaxID=3028117 RepID=UPI001684519A|nr:LysM peptidoglycan-binding domain-containing protein [Microcoleus sp. FACHB-1515]MBD2089956.1 LysM peptidoglycan-binding domain-containing protein [Microcoleus sp. FACHB-1515]
MALEKARLTNTDTGEDFEVIFNPEEYTVNKDNNFAQIAVPGLRSPLLQFVHGNLKTLEMELLVDTYEAHRTGNKPVNQAHQDVRDMTRKITHLLDINPQTHAPPVLLFVWGSLTFRCVLARVSEKFIMFLPTGIPVRARLQVTFNEFTNAEFEAKEVKRETADYSQFYLVGQGETLSSIAARVYENATLWRPIALQNQIDDPHELAIGRRLLIPQLPFRDSDTGEVMQ